MFESLCKFKASQNDYLTVFTLYAVLNFFSLNMIFFEIRGIHKFSSHTRFRCSLNHSCAYHNNHGLNLWKRFASVGDFLTVMFNTVDCLDCCLFRYTKYFFLQKFLFVCYDKSAVLKVIYNIVASHLFTHAQGGSLSGLNSVIWTKVLSLKVKDHARRKKAGETSRQPYTFLHGLFLQELIIWKCFVIAV